MNDVHHLPLPNRPAYPQLGELETELTTVIDRYEDQSLAAIIGILRMVEHKLLERT